MEIFKINAETANHAASDDALSTHQASSHAAVSKPVLSPASVVWPRYLSASRPLIRLFDDRSVRLGDRVRGLQSHTQWHSVIRHRPYTSRLQLSGSRIRRTNWLHQRCFARCSPALSLRDCHPLQPPLVRADDATIERCRAAGSCYCVARTCGV